MKDTELLEEYVLRHSEEAFATLVQRHIGLVYSVALRQLGDAHKAEDVAQAVFIVLARKAAGLRKETILTGWLYQTTQLTSSSFLRSEIRRQRREQESYMQSTLDQAESEAPWEKFSPLLEQAMGRLGEVDRAAVLLRFFEGKPMLEVATALDMNESTARKRISRAVEKLRSFFLKRGVNVSAIALTGVIGANAVQAAPLGLANSITATALTGTASTVTASSLVASTLKLIVSAKIKAAAALTVAVALAAVTTTLVVKEVYKTARTGLFIVRDQATHKFFLRRTLPNSPAKRAGLPIGMILSKINGIDVEWKSVDEISEMLSGVAGTTVGLEFVDPNTGLTNAVQIVREKF